MLIERERERERHSDIESDNERVSDRRWIARASGEIKKIKSES